MEYHRTKDIIYVQQLLGHKDVRNTMIYVNIEHVIFGAGDNGSCQISIMEQIFSRRRRTS